MKILNAFNVARQEVLPDEELLKHWSFPTMFKKSTNKLVVTKDVIEMVKLDSHAYKTVIQKDAAARMFNCRIKSPESIEMKVNRHPGLKFQSVFNDILSIRIERDEYLRSVPEYYRLVDMTEGKTNDDGYRAQHLYYKMDNYHYPIEVQIWSGRDIEFNTWSHMLTYKYSPGEISLELRKMYDAGEINSFDEFTQEVYKLWK